MKREEKARMKKEVSSIITFVLVHEHPEVIIRWKVKFVMPNVEVPDTLTVAAEVVVAAIKKAHDLTHLMYPDLDTETQLFGTIRSKLADQILFVWSKKGQ